VTPAQRYLARHFLGLDNPSANGKSYRNRYYARRGHAAWIVLHDMVGEGLANLSDENGETTFWLTRKGAELALNPGEKLDPEDFP
jgi:hypothetical protein